MFFDIVDCTAFVELTIAVVALPTPVPTAPPTTPVAVPVIVLPNV